MLRIPAASIEYLRVPVAILDATGTPADPTSITVHVGFSSSADTTPSTWHAASWETSEPVGVDVGYKHVSTVYKARVLVGDEATDIAAGTWHVFVKLTDSPETPVMLAGQLNIV